MAESSCRHFLGDRPCGFNDNCDQRCSYRAIPKHRILIVHLGALGAVLRSTALLRSIHKKYPHCHITWVTEAPGHHLLKNISLIDRVVSLDAKNILSLYGRIFDVAFVIDKSSVAAGLIRQIECKSIYGFVSDKITGSILPATPSAQTLWELGLSNQKKFFVNTKPETQLICEALELEYNRDSYVIEFSKKELAESNTRRQSWAQHGGVIIGINTGCSSVIPYKKLTVERHRELILKLKKIPNTKIVLLGGPEDKIRNQQIAHGLDVIESPTNLGLRDGLVSVSTCDIVVSGDSLGLHMAVALKKWTVAWFGPTCAHEIDLFDRGVKILTKARCSPCWKRSCDVSPMCYDLVDLDALVNGVDIGVQKIISSEPIKESGRPALHF